MFRYHPPKIWKNTMSGFSVRTSWKVTWAQFHRAAKQRNLLSNIKQDYQPKCIHFVWKFGWQPKKFAKPFFLVSNFFLHKQLYVIGPCCEIDLTYKRPKTQSIQFLVSAPITSDPRGGISSFLFFLLRNDVQFQPKLLDWLEFSRAVL